MICRIWHGWTTLENADIYENMLKDEIFKEIKAKNVSGYHGIQLFRRDDEVEVEFITIMYFESIESISKFAGDDYEKAVVPQKARNVLSRFDDSVRIFELKEDQRF
jgi:hypothetical protein